MFISDVQGEGVSMRLVIVGAAMVLAVTGAAVAKDKKATVAQAANSCSASHLKAGKPKLDCKSTGTVAQPSNGNLAEPQLGYGSSPWFVPSSL